jgi:hypothetical protein
VEFPVKMRVYLARPGARGKATESPGRRRKKDPLSQKRKGRTPKRPAFLSLFKKKEA